MTTVDKPLPYVLGDWQQRAYSNQEFGYITVHTFIDMKNLRKDPALRHALCPLISAIKSK